MSKKRDGRMEKVFFDKITSRIDKLSYGLDSTVIDPIFVTQKITNRVYDEITTTQLDELAARICASMCTVHPDYGTLAARIEISNLQKNTEKVFSKVMDAVYNYHDLHGKHVPLISKKVWELSQEHAERINAEIIHNRDFKFNFFGFKTLERSYLLKINGVVVESPQNMIMRVSLGMHQENIDAAIESYHLMSNHYFTHATPTLFHAGTPRPQMSSCFLLGVDDSITGIYKNISDCAQISKWAGGIGIHISNIRGKDSIIRGTNGKTSGLMPMLRVYNETSRYVNQSGKRAGSFAMYIEPWHCDIVSFLDAKKNHGNEDDRARDLFYALWIPDLFMERIEKDEDWSLMCPDECRGLDDVYGEEFNKLYMEYEEKGMFRKKMPARKLWQYVIDSQIETGTPYICYKDSVNKRSNQKNE